MGDPEVPVKELIQTSNDATSDPENNSSSLCQGSPKLDPATIKPETQGALFISPQIDANDGADVGEAVQASLATDAEPQTRCYARVPLNADFIAPRGRSLNSVGQDAYGGGSRPRTNKICANGEAPSNIPRHNDGAHTAESEASARKVNKNTWRILPRHLKESKSAKTSVPGEIQTVSTTEMKARCFPCLR